MREMALPLALALIAALWILLTYLLAATLRRCEPPRSSTARPGGKVPTDNRPATHFPVTLGPVNHGRPAPAPKR